LTKQVPIVNPLLTTLKACQAHASLQCSVVIILPNIKTMSQPIEGIFADFNFSRFCKKLLCYWFITTVKSQIQVRSWTIHLLSR